jgi:hypothetical protein
MSTNGGSITTARAMATRCCWPPEVRKKGVALEHHAETPLFRAQRVDSFAVD